MLDKIVDELVRKGKKKQERHFQSNVRALNANLAVLTTAGDALRTARRDGLDPFNVVFDAVGGEDQLAATVESAKKLIRWLDLDARDLIQTQYAFVRGVLLALYAALEVRAVHGIDPALQGPTEAWRVKFSDVTITCNRNGTLYSTASAMRDPAVKRAWRFIDSGSGPRFASSDRAFLIGLDETGNCELVGHLTLDQTAATSDAIGVAQEVALRLERGGREAPPQDRTQLTPFRSEPTLTSSITSAGSAVVDVPNLLLSVDLR